MSCTKLLVDLIAIRDALIVEIASGAAVVEYEIRGRRVRRSDPIEALKQINKMIDMEENRSDRIAHGPARNIANLTNP
jgi:hypothetical protein